MHADVAAVTVNVALADEAASGGGQLIGGVGGGFAVLARNEGDASVHASSLLHGVTRLREGVERHTLILFLACE